MQDLEEKRNPTKQPQDRYFSRHGTQHERFFEKVMESVLP